MSPSAAPGGTDRPASRMPIEPPRRSSPAAERIPGGYSLDADSFEVEEVPLYEHSGQGDHLFAWIEKRGWSTHALVDRLADRLDCPSDDIGFAGLKDRHAVTRQWLSFPPGIEPDDLASVALDGFRLLDVSRHGHKLKLGHLRGNRFWIGLQPPGSSNVDETASRLRALLEDLERRGVPNYFGAQRFGSDGRNLDKGLRLLREGPRGRTARRMPARLRRLIVSAVQSEVFNRVLARRIDDCDVLRSGDVAWLHHNGAAFVVEDPLAERVRCERFEISPTGPLPGPKCLRPGGEQRLLEDGCAEELGVDARAFGAFRSHPGERRPLRIPLLAPSVSVERADGGPERLRVGFELGRGSFATTVLRELVERPPWFEDEPAGPDQS